MYHAKVDTLRQFDFNIYRSHKQFPNYLIYRKSTFRGYSVSIEYKTDSTFKRFLKALHFSSYINKVVLYTDLLIFSF